MGLELPELEEGRYIADKMKAQAEAALSRPRKCGGKAPQVKTDTVLATGPSRRRKSSPGRQRREVDLIVIGSRGLAGKTSDLPGEHRASKDGNLLALFSTGVKS